MTATDHAVGLAKVAALAASDKLAQHILAFDVSEQLAITDVFLLASGTNDRQVNAIVDEVEDKLRDSGAKPLRREGQREGRWGRRWTTATSSSTCSTRRSGSSMPSSGSGVTARAILLPEVEPQRDA